MLQTEHIQGADFLIWDNTVSLLFRIILIDLKANFVIPKCREDVLLHIHIKIIWAIVEVMTKKLSTTKMYKVDVFILVSNVIFLYELWFCLLNIKKKSEWFEHFLMLLKT